MRLRFVGWVKNLIEGERNLKERKNKAKAGPRMRAGVSLLFFRLYFFPIGVIFFLTL